MKKFTYPEIKTADLRGEEVMAGILKTSYESRATGVKLITVEEPAETAEGYKYWKSWQQ